MEKVSKESSKERGVIVVQQLPTQPIREYEEKDKAYDVITVEEAQTEILEKTREIYRIVTEGK